MCSWRQLAQTESDCNQHCPWAQKHGNVRKPSEPSQEHCNEWDDIY